MAVLWLFHLPPGSPVFKLGRKDKFGVTTTSNVNRQDDSKCSRKTFTRRLGMLTATTVPLLLRIPDLDGRLFQTHAAEVKDEMLQRLKDELKKVVTKQKAPGLLRLVFHDAGTFNAMKQSGGMNGSIVLELDRPENAGLMRSVKILEKVKSTVDSVSWADLIATAGAEAISVCGGPEISVSVGRVDSSVPDPEGELPEENLTANSLKAIFKAKGFSTQEMVVLSGAHTIGGKGFGNPGSFDNSYFKILVQRPWAISGKEMTSMVGLPTDRAIAEDGDCQRWLQLYSQDEELFFKDFSAAYLKLTNLGANWKARTL